MTYDELVDEILPDAPGCPRMTVRDRVRDGARQFARESLVWDVEAERRTADSGETEFDLILPREGQFWTVTAVEIDEKPVAHEWDREERIVRLPRGRRGELVIRVALEPKDGQASLPQALAEWSEAIKDYARYRLMVMPGQEWTQPEMGMAYRRQYDDRVNDARIRKARSHSTQPLRTAPQPFI